MRIRISSILVATLLLVAVLVSCAPKVAPATSSAPQESTPRSAVAAAPLPAAAQAPVKPAWEAKWEALVEQAKKERRVVLYTTLGATERQTIVGPFMSKYGVNVEAVTGLSGQNGERLAAQRRAGLYQVDVWLSGGTTLNLVKDAVDRLESAFILPELTEPDLIKKTWYFGDFSWMDKNHLMLVSLIDLKEPLSINTNLVKPGEITAYRDLLNPKWKGKMSIQDPTASGGGDRWFHAVLKMGVVDENYMRELAKQELAITRDRRLQVEWLAQGKHAVAIAPYTATVTEFIRIGAPIDRFRIEPSYLAGATSGIGLVNRAPHPGAARLFINWLLSQEGAIFHSQAVGAQSQRLDVPTGHLEPSRVLAPGLKAYMTDSEEFLLEVQPYQELAKQLLASSFK